jgi:hypothetical protein
MVSFLLWCLLRCTHSISGSVHVLLGGGGAPVLALPEIWFFVGVLVLRFCVAGVGVLVTGLLLVVLQIWFFRLLVGLQIMVFSFACFWRS